MRRTASFILYVLAMFALVAVAAAKEPTDDAAAQKAADVLKAARQALGGETRLTAMKTLTVKGTHRRTMGEMQMNGETEIAIALPDKYLRSQTDRMFGNSVTVENGFNGDEPVQRSNSSGGGGQVMFRIGGPGGPNADPAAIKAAQLRNARADFARLILGFTASTPPFMDATFAYAGEAVSDDGRADVIEIKGRDNFTVKLFIDQATKRPLMITYTGPRPMMRVVRREGAPGAHRSDDTPGEAARQAASEPPPGDAEMQVFFEDYREVDGVWLPHRISRAMDGKPIEELEISRYKVNDTIKPSVFEVK